MNESSVPNDIHYFPTNDNTSLTLEEGEESMYDKSIPLCLFYACAESGDTSLFSFSVFKSWGGLGFDESSGDLNRVVEVGGDYVFLLGSGGAGLFDLLFTGLAPPLDLLSRVGHTNESDLHPRPFGLNPPTLTDFQDISLVLGE
jgi:hypothetical protein